ncbi:MAG: ShlB/FhaC/HecB family hemolysin secretion/activation protein [Acidobacteriota bacterium]
MTRRFLSGLILLVASAAHGQTGEWKVFLRADEGFLAVDESRTVAAVPGFAAGGDAVRRTLIQDVNTALHGLGRLCNQAFNLAPEAECPADAAAIRRLTASHWADVRTAWSRWQRANSTRPSLDQFFNENADPIISLGRVLPALTALDFDAGVDTFDGTQGALIFTVVPAVRAWSYAASPEDGKDHVLVHDADQGPPLLSEAELRRVLDPLVGGPWRRQSIEAAIEKRYPPDRVLRSLGLHDEVFAVNAEHDRRQVEIREGARLAAIEIGETVGEALAARAMYLLLPFSEFHALGARRSKEYARGERPILGAEIGRQEAELKAIGLVVGLVEDPARSGARVMTVGRDRDAAGATPAPPGLPAWIRLEGGAQYRPDQGVHALSRVTFQNLGGEPQTLQVSAGGSNAGALGDTSYTRDFLFFNQLRRRMSVTGRGASESEYQRLLSGVDTNERRWTAAARANLEWIPDRTGTSLGFWVETERTSVVLARMGAPDDTLNFAAVNGGVRFSRRRRGLGLQRTLSIESRLHGGVALAQLPSFSVATASLSFAQELGAGIEAHITGRAMTASRGTPLVEQPALGGADTVRGFRKDDGIGLRAWHVQNEVWLPLPIRSRAAPLDWLRRNVKASPFLDVGALYQAAQGSQGTRFGAGAGLRIQVARGLILKADYGYGFGVAPRQQGGRPYLGADLGF